MSKEKTVAEIIDTIRVHLRKGDKINVLDMEVAEVIGVDRINLATYILGYINHLT